MILRDNQKKMIKDAIKYLKHNKPLFIEAPTGYGKSYTLVGLIEKIKKNKELKNKKIIISTRNNKLVYDLFNIFKKNIEDEELKKKAGILIGNNNYVDVDFLQKLTNLDKETIDIELTEKDIFKYLQEIDISNPYSNKLLLEYFFDYFSNKFNIEQKNFLKELIARREIEQEKFKILFEKYEIIFTNHTFLYVLKFYKKYDLSSNYILLLDEVDTIKENFELLVNKSFSPYRLKSYINVFFKLLKSQNYKIPKNFIKSLKNIQIKMIEIIDFYSNPSLKGKIQRDKNKTKVILNFLSKNLPEKDSNFFKRIDLEINKKQLSPEIKKTLKVIKQELNEFFEVTNAYDIVIKYSEVKGFPSLDSISGNVMKRLFTFWKEINQVVGVSAFLVLADSFREKILWNIGVPKEKINIIEYIPEENLFNKSQIKIFFVNKEFPLPYTNKDKLIENENDEEDTIKRINPTWLNQITNIIVRTYNNKNSLILTGSYKEVDAIYSILIHKLSIPEEKVIRAEQGFTMESIIDKFKEKGKFLIAPRNYGRGIDLKGELLEKLYICKLPFPVIGNRKWIQIKEKNKDKYFYYLIDEMLINLYQYLGRLKRTPTDKGDIYLLDSRLHIPLMFNKIVKVCQKQGEINKL